jgi:hypothetical protein
MPFHRNLNALSCWSVHLSDSFFKPRQDINRTETLPHLYRLFKNGGRFSIYSKADSQEFDYKIYWESEIAKFIEAASYSLSLTYDTGLDALLNEVIAQLTSIQQPDGYLNAYITFKMPDKRWKNLFVCHELFNAGTLAEAAVAHFNATGKRTLLEPICRYIDYIDTVFGPEAEQLKGYCGHPGIEMALVTLYNLTRKERYLQLARFFVEQRGQQPTWFEREDNSDSEMYWVEMLRKYYRRQNRNFYEYNQSHAPAREQCEAVGHAVRAMFFYSAMADIASRFDDEGLYEACMALWDDVCNRKMYITGGVGSEYDIEGIGLPYHLPNRNAYAETCAAAGLVFWNHRLLNMTGDRKYADVIERVLYNLLPASVSLDGKAFFYENPLESDGTFARSGTFVCACCPPNIAKLYAGLGSYFYSFNDSEIYINQFAQGTAYIPMGNEGVTIVQTTDYPWSGSITISVASSLPMDFSLKLRLPSWCRKAVLAINGDLMDIQGLLDNGYIAISRRWSGDDTICFKLDMLVERMYAHPMVKEDMCCIALQRGPVVYCLEEADNIRDLHLIGIPEDSALTVTHIPEMLGGISVITGVGQLQQTSGREQELYRALPSGTEPFQFTAIPYAVWSNRGKGTMRVWLRSV